MASKMTYHSAPDTNPSPSASQPARTETETETGTATTDNPRPPRPALAEFTSPQGDTMVVLTKNEFTKLLEAAAHHQTAKEMAEIEEVVKGIRQGNIETFPAELVERLVLGEENPVRVFREYRGLAVKDLATAVGVSPQMISQIEGGRKSPALDTAKRIAAALKVTLDDLA